MASSAKPNRFRRRRFGFAQVSFDRVVTGLRPFCGEKPPHHTTPLGTFRSPPAFLVHDGQHVARIYCRADGRRHFLYNSLFWRLDFILHFHRFDHDEALARFHGRIFRD